MKISDLTLSLVVRSMWQGLEKFHEDPMFKFAMSTYGWASKETHICLGCLATAAIQVLSGVKFTPDSISYRDARAEAVGMLNDDLDDLEESYDTFRFVGEDIASADWLENLLDQCFSNDALREYYNHPNVSGRILDSYNYMDFIEPLKILEQKQKAFEELAFVHH